MRNESRLTLTIRSYPSESSIERVCELIYQAKDKTLIASLSSLPYTVGRGFSHREAEHLSVQLRQLNVGFLFKDPQSTEIPFAYDPHDKTSPSLRTTQKDVPLPPQSRIAKVFKSKKGMLLAAVGCCILIGLYFLPLKDIFHEVFPGTQDRVASEDLNQSDLARATLERISNIVEMKRKTELIWSRAQEKALLFDEDGVRTMTDSHAILRYREGSTVSMKPNTLLIIGRTEDESRRNLNLEDGSLQTRLLASNQNRTLRIHTKAGVLEMQNPKEGSAETRVETSIRGDTFKVAVAAGSVQLKPAASTSSEETVQITGGQTIEAEGGVVGKPTAFTPRLETLSPRNSETIRVNPEHPLPMEFKWEDLGEVDYYEWLLASDPELNNILLTQKVKIPTVTINYIDLGKLYWKVRAVQSGITFESELMSLHVEKFN